MKLFKIFAKKKTQKIKRTDLYQESLESFGRGQLQIIAQRGLRIERNGFIVR